MPRRQDTAPAMAFAAAQRRRHAKRIDQDCAVEVERRLDRRALARQSSIVDAGAAAGPTRRATIEQRRAQYRRRRGVGDAFETALTLGLDPVRQTPVSRAGFRRLDRAAA